MRGHAFLIGFEQLANSLNPVTNHRVFHPLLVEGVPVEYKTLTPTLSPGEREQVVRGHAFLIDFEQLANSLNPVNNHRVFHPLLVEGVPVEYKALTPALSPGEREQVVRGHAFLIDFEQLANSLNPVTNQRAFHPLMAEGVPVGYKTLTPTLSLLNMARLPGKRKPIPSNFTIWTR